MPYGTEQSSEPIHHLQIIPLRRSDGVNIVNRAAEISGNQGIRYSTGEVFNYSHLNRNVLHRQTSVAFDMKDVQWAQIQNSLWNEVNDGLEIPGGISRTRAAQTTGPGNQLGREYRMEIPRELTSEQAIDLGNTFARTLSSQYRMPIQIVIHKPKNDKSNYPVYMLSPTQELGDGGFGRTTIWDMPEGGRLSRERFASDRQQHQESWTRLTNKALREAGVEAQYKERLATIRPASSGAGCRQS